MAEGRAEADAVAEAQKCDWRSGCWAKGLASCSARRTMLRGGDGPLGVVFPGWPELGPTRSASESWSVLSRPPGPPSKYSTELLTQMCRNP